MRLLSFLDVQKQWMETPPYETPFLEMILFVRAQTVIAENFISFATNQIYE